MTPTENNFVLYITELRSGASVLFCHGPLLGFNNSTTKYTNAWWEFLAIKYKKLCNSLNIRSTKILQGMKLVKNIVLHNLSYLTFSQKVNIKRDI